jgi:hypothetical protein
MHSEILGRDSIYRAEVATWFTTIREHLRNIEEYFKHSRDQTKNFLSDHGRRVCDFRARDSDLMNSTLGHGGTGFECIHKL